jgi:predicted transcriptional regulator
MRLVARALRIERAGGRYQVTARGNEWKRIYRQDSDLAHFLVVGRGETMQSSTGRLTVC